MAFNDFFCFFGNLDVEKRVKFGTEHISVLSLDV